MRPVSAFLLALVAACGGNRVSPAPAADTAVPDRLTYRPAMVRYRAVAHRQVDQDISGRTQSSRVITRYVLATAVMSAENGMDVSMTLDSIAIDGQMGVSPGEIAEARGSTFIARLSETGRLDAFTGGDTAVTLVRQLASRLRDFFPRLPPGGVEPGQTWTDTTETSTDVGGVVLTVRSISDLQAVEWTSYAGRPALAIRAVTNYQMSGAGEQSGQPLTLDGSGRRHALEYVSSDGVYLGTVAADTSRFQVLLTQMGMAIPGRQWSADTIVAVD